MSLHLASPSPPNAHPSPSPRAHHTSHPSRSFASLHQKPRDAHEDECFGRALHVMADVYASAVGTTVLQIKEIPPRPPSLDGALCLFGVTEGTSEASLREQLRQFGAVERIDFDGPLRRDQDAVVVYFSSHESALAGKRAGPKAIGGCGGVDTLYNERSYDGTVGHDDGRGW